MDTRKNPLRLEKLLAERGLAARRKAAELVRAGRVTVNGRSVLEPGLRVDAAADRVCVDGRLIPSALPPPRTILLYKPRGYICSRAAEQGRTVYELIREVKEPVKPVGRLDKDSEGLLLLSTDGDLILRMTHPRYEHEKTYEVAVTGEVSAAVLRRLNGAFDLDGYRTRPAHVTRLSRCVGAGRTVLRFVLKEGRNRQVRRMCADVGLGVENLKRTSEAGLDLGSLEPGAWRDVTAEWLGRYRPQPVNAGVPAVTPSGCEPSSRS